MTEVIRMTEAQAKRVYKLAKKECCNCYNGFCVLLDTSCPQCITRSLICKWFIRAVLPADMPLYVELTGDKGKSKPCISCGKPFVPTGSRSIYCPDCAVRITREKAAARKRKQRLEVTL